MHVQDGLDWVDLEELLQSAFSILPYGWDSRIIGVQFLKYTNRRSEVAASNPLANERDTEHL